MSGPVKPVRAVQVELSSRTPSGMRVWDEAHALGLALLARHRDVESCTISVHASLRDSLRWKIGRTAWLAVHWALTPHAEAVLDVLDGDEGAWKRLRTRLPTPLPPKTRPQGKVHHLGELLKVERAHPLCADLPSVEVTWGRFGRRPTRGLRLGSCEPSDPPLIRIHPVLDHETVPGWFIGFVLFHELLHVVFPPDATSGERRSVHSDAFRRAERQHPRFEDALAWETAHLPVLLARCRAR